MLVAHYMCSLSSETTESMKLSCKHNTFNQKRNFDTYVSLKELPHTVLSALFNFNCMFESIEFVRKHCSQNSLSQSIWIICGKLFNSIQLLSRFIAATMSLMISRLLPCNHETESNRVHSSRAKYDFLFVNKFANQWANVILAGSSL